MDIGFIVLMIVAAYAFGYACTYLSSQSDHDQSTDQSEPAFSHNAEKKNQEFPTNYDENVVLRLSSTSMDIVKNAKSPLNVRNNGQAILKMIEFMDKISDLEHGNEYVFVEKGKNKVVPFPQFDNAYIFPTHKVLHLYFQQKHVRILEALSIRFKSVFRDQMIMRIIHFFDDLLKNRDGKSIIMLDSDQKRVTMELS